MSLDLNMSTATISRRVNSIKNKIRLIEKWWCFIAFF
jgi:hypothetical protein